LQLPDFWHFRLQVVQPVINVSPVMALAVLHWVHWLVVQSMVAKARLLVRQLVVPPVPSLVPQPTRAPAATALIKIAMASVTGLLAVINIQYQEYDKQAGTSGLFSF
jgi:hypothetical protein